MIESRLNDISDGAFTPALVLHELTFRCQTFHALLTKFSYENPSKKDFFIKFSTFAGSFKIVKPPAVGLAILGPSIGMLKRPCVLVSLVSMLTMRCSCCHFMIHAFHNTPNNSECLPAVIGSKRRCYFVSFKLE